MLKLDISHQTELRRYECKTIGLTCRISSRNWCIGIIRLPVLVQQHEPATEKCVSIDQGGIALSSV